MPGNRVSRGPGVAGSGERLCFWAKKTLVGSRGRGRRGQQYCWGSRGRGRRGQQYFLGSRGRGSANCCWGPGVAAVASKGVSGPRDPTEKFHWVRFFVFFALICFSFDWRLLDSSNGPLVSTWRLARFVLWLLIGGEGRTWVGLRHRLTSFPRHSHGLSVLDYVQ